MVGYVLSYGYLTNKSLKKYEIKSFDVLSENLDKYIYIVQDNKIIYEWSDLIYRASIYGHIQVLKWLKKSKYSIKLENLNSYYEKKATIFFRFNSYLEAFMRGFCKILKWFDKLNHNFKNNKQLKIDCHIKKNNVKFIKYLTNNNYKIFYSKTPYHSLTDMKTINFLIDKINIKKIIKWTVLFKSKKIIKFKTKNNYLKGYKKN